MANRRAISTKRWFKRKGYTVKGISRFHLWGDWSPTEWGKRNTRATLKRELRREMGEM